MNDTRKIGAIPVSDTPTPDTQWFESLALWLARRRIQRVHCRATQATRNEPQKWLRAFGYDVLTDLCMGWDGIEWRRMSLQEYEALCLHDISTGDPVFPAGTKLTMAEAKAVMEETKS